MTLINFPYKHGIEYLDYAIKVIMKWGVTNMKFFHVYGFLTLLFLT